MLLLVIQTGGMAAVTITFAAYFRELTGLSARTPILASCVLAVLALVNCLAVRAGSRAQSALMVLKIVAILTVVAAGAWFLGRWPDASPAGVSTTRGFLDGPSVGALAFGAAMVPVLFAYDGWQTANFVAGEVREPRRNLPRALVLGVTGVVLLYLAINFVCVQVLRAEALAGTTTPASAVMEAAFGRAGARLIAIGIAISTLGFLSQSMLTAPRVYFAMARDRAFFRAVAWVDPRRRVPTVAILLQAAMAIVIALSGRCRREPEEEEVHRNHVAENLLVPEACVVAATGTSMANHLALAAVVEVGDEILIEEPTYEPLLSTAQYLGARIRRFPRRFEEGFRVDPDELERAMTPRTRAIVLTDLHNPSGVRTTEEALARIAVIADGHGAHVIVDEVYLEACLDPAVRSNFHLAPNIIATCSLTKAYGLSGLRCGWVLAPAPLAERMWRINDLYGSIPAHPAELLSVIALDHLDEIAARARKILMRNRPSLDRFLDSRPELEAVRPPAGTVVFPGLAGGRVDSLCRLLRDRYETTVVPGRFFGMPDHFRIGIGGDPGMVEEGLARLGRSLDELGR